MPVNLTDDPVFTTPVTAPAGGDARTASSVQTPIQALANRTANLKARVDAVIDGNEVTASVVNVFESPTITKFISLSSGVGGIPSNWEVSSTGTAATNDDGVDYHVPIHLPSGAVIKRVRVGITVTGTPGSGNAPYIQLRRNMPDTGTGLTSSSAVATGTGATTAGSSVISTGTITVSIDNNVDAHSVRLHSASGGATNTAFNWLEIQFEDHVIGNG